MKKILAMVLALLMCLSLCACGKPLSEDYQTEDELVAALEEYFSDENWDGLTGDKYDKKVSEFTEALQNNTAIHHYFQKSDAAVQLAYRLCEETSIGEYFAFDVFEACNTDDWFYGIANPEDSLGWPLFYKAWGNDQPTCASIADEIRDDFIDPLSVSVLGGSIGFKDPVDGFFSVPFSYRGVVKVRAANKLGAYITQQYVITGSFGGSVRIIEEYNGPDYEILDLLKEMGAEGFFVLH